MFADEDPERWRWIAVGLVAALKASAIAALSSFETAAPEDVLDLANAGRMAPLAMLLRRARSERYLAPPERLDVPLSHLDVVLRLVAYRNEAVHGADAQRPATLRADSHTALDMITHFLVTAPAFSVAEHGVVCALARDEIIALEQQLEALG
ncbi:hypothetical protein [Hyphomonas pacifica]|uniref:Apea-like HEPN domain-containing protein n=1 Tax=Hyphomonas pacifica TaxID=1280941 RepID=A0A062U151_9PROT|nr:hypothetical protein [Hyphomonas pacifica]KCZ51468.1 hypothetical protein HY2_11290 [Hyphomonas pacifica]RAN35489.1 hypothetical protein HY3_08085 [Hyphomonas pacifica]RAN36855.1 hypothetical protein HY11_11475 [Hyphomonas pacifica]